MNIKKEHFFRLLLIATPFLILLLLEAGLRVSGYGENLDLFVTLEKNPAYWITNPQIGRRYFLSQNFLPATAYDAFRKQKPANAYRIFVLGESAAAGFPYFNNGAFPRMLQTRLQARHPGQIIEMVNLGLPAVSSFSLLDLTGELVNYRPDAILIYAGHNEFYGAFGSASTETFGPRRWVIKLYLRLQRLRLVQLLRQTFSGRKSSSPDKRATMMARLVGQKNIPYRGPLYEQTLQNFRANLTEMIQIFHARGVKVMLSEVVSNIGDLKPFVSLFDENTNRAEWQKFFDRGVALMQVDSNDMALSVFQRAAQLDSSPAILHFEIAKALMQRRHFAEAQQAFLHAKDLDALRFRASEDLNRIIRELGAQLSVPVAPMYAAFAAASPHEIIGNNLMLEHVHANLPGYFLMAKIFDASIAREHFISIGSTALAPPDSVLWQRMGVTELDEEVARLRMQVLLSNWPFQPEAQKVPPAAEPPKNLLEQLAQSQWREELSWDAAHWQLAEHYTKTNQPEKTAREYEALVLGMPYVVAPYLRLGLIYLARNRLDAAFEIFNNSLAVEPTALAQKWLGAICLQKNQIAQGLDFLRQALQREPNDPETLYNVSIGYAKSGDFTNAKVFARQLVQQHPNYPGAQAHWQRLLALGNE